MLAAEKQHLFNWFRSSSDPHKFRKQLKCDLRFTIRDVDYELTMSKLIENKFTISETARHLIYSR